MKLRHRAGFTLVELLIAGSVSAVLGLIMYGVASEGVVAFARNVSINRSYSNARQSVDRIGVAMQSAGHVPILVDPTGADVSGASTATAPQAGIRFWRYSSSPLYSLVANPASITVSSLSLSLTKPGTGGSTGVTAVTIPPPVVGDMITISAISFQAQVTSVVTASGTSTVSYSGTLASNTNPTLTAAALVTANSNTATYSTGGKMACLDWTSVAYIAINNQLRYFSKFISGTTDVTAAANYEVLTYLTAKRGGVTTPLPFSLGPAPSINIDLYAEAPDYNNRTSVSGTSNGFNGVNTANTYTFMQTALSPRPSAILHSPY